MCSSLSQVSSGGSKVKSEASEKIGPPPVLKVSAISIKEEPDYGIEDVVIKEEPFLYGNEFGEGGSAPAAGDAAAVADISGASTSKQHNRLGCSQHGVVPAGAGQLQQHVHLEHPASGPHRCSKYTSSSGIGLQRHINAMHSTETSFQFPICGCLFSSFVFLAFLLVKYGYGGHLSVIIVVVVRCDRHLGGGEALVVGGGQALEEGGNGRRQGGWPGKPLPPLGCPTVRRR
ncbi:uncharacterized protein LOC108667913 [Hyalella azteca]|uniref:Uncharacterized protein LOC108667913 n=1 Tax=Hyalella azteca TaxID=294128 RepID=A0A8B7NAA4_HYAAZ|nr:uncharacterized protein LOC108667913 [Hyalella azteca]